MDQPKSKVETSVDVMNAIKKKGRGYKIPINISVPAFIIDNEGRILRSCPGLEQPVLNHVLNWQQVCGDN
jgi:hypothetical protein